MAYSVSSRLDFSEYIYIANLVDELPLNMMSRQDLQRIICTELNGVEQYRFEEDNGAIWLTAFIKFYSKTAAETAVHQLNTKDKIGAATISSLLDQYMQLEDILRSNHSVFCTFSFIIVEQVNMNLTECEIISLFTNYGAVKIAKTSSPMCIGFENFAEALAAKIDQNRWNNSNSYISVKVFPRMKEQVLGFMKARSSCSLASSDSNVFDPFSVCMICDRCVQPHAYEEFNNDHGHIGHLADTHTSQHTFQESISNDIEDIEIESGKQIPKHGLSFDPNDFVFYLRIERKAFTNLNKERRCDSPSSDTGISSDGSSHTVSSSEIRYDVPDSQSNIDNHFVFQTFSQDTPSDQAPCASFQIHNESSKENFTENRNYAAMNYGPQSANDDESDSELQSNETRFTEDFAYPQCSCAYQSHDCTAKTCNLGCSETEVETEFPFTAQQIYSYSNTDSLSGLHISEIEKNFKIYGMKMRPKKQESDPKIILIPFVYYSENDTSPANTYLQGPKVGNMAYSSTSKIESSIRRSSKKISTHTKFRSSSVQEVPVLDERNFPTLREAKDRTTEKPRAQSQKKKIADNAESPVVSTAADTPNEGFREIRNTKIRSDSIETAQLDKKYGRSVKVTNRSFSEPRELQHRDTLKSSFNIKLVFSNKSRYNNHSDTKAQNSSQRSRTEEHSKFMPRNDYSSDEGRNSKFNKRSGPRRIEYSSHDVKSRAIKIVNDRTIRKPQNTKSHSLP